jgi:flagellar motor switch protein FliN/FliY
MNDSNARGPMGPGIDAQPDARHVTPLSAPPADLTPQRGSADSLSFVMDVPVEVTIELGRKTAKIGEVLRLGPGSILELSKANGEPLDVYVNNRLIARGEAVVVGERYGIRLTEVLVGDERGGRGSKE